MSLIFIIINKNDNSMRLSLIRHFQQKVTKNSIVFPFAEFSSFFYFENLLLKEEEAKEEDSDNENMEDDEEFDKETLEKVGTFVKKSTCYVPHATISLKFNRFL